MKKQKGFSPIEILIALAILIITLAGGMMVWGKGVLPLLSPNLPIPQTTPYETPTTVSPPIKIGPTVGGPVSPGIFEEDLRRLPTSRSLPTEYYRPISDVACQTVKNCYDTDGITPKGVCESPCVLACINSRCTNINPPGGICLSKDTLIATPKGLIPVQNLRQGMRVWTLDARGERKAVLILQTVKTPVLDNHKMVHLLLGDGRELFASPGHPTADGKTLGQLSIGDVLNGSLVVKAELVPYQQDYTYDILPEGETSLYWANGVLLKSTLSQ